MQVKLTNTEIDLHTVKLAGTIIDSGKKYSEIWPVPMGGYPVAVVLSNILQIPISNYLKSHSLIVDDIIDSGKTLSNYDNDKAVLLVKNNKENEVTYYAEKIEGWIKFPWEKENDIEDTVIRQIEFIGENPNREGLKETPERVRKSWQKLYGGYNEDPKKLLKVFDKETYNQMVLLKDIEFYSTCEHHMLPFFGKAHIAYIPKDKVLGVSKLARLLEVFSRRLQIQERIGEQITCFIMESLNAKGAGCILEAQHFCMTSRGVEKQKSKMVTSSLKGVFLEKKEARTEFIGLVK